jgi:sugar lactone lactonase YvrE
VEPRIGVNPITIDAAHEYVYYGAMHGTSLYRVRTSDLLNKTLSAAELAERVERFGDKPVSDGITMDTAGNVYITSVSENGIGVVKPDGSYELLFSDPERLSWPDGMSCGPDGKVYATVNRLHKSARLNAGVAESQPPYYVVRFDPLAPCPVGR